MFLDDMKAGAQLHSFPCTEMWKQTIASGFLVTEKEKKRSHKFCRVSDLKAEGCSLKPIFPLKRVSSEEGSFAKAAHTVTLSMHC